MFASAVSTPVECRGSARPRQRYIASAGLLLGAAFPSPFGARHQKNTKVYSGLYSATEWEPTLVVSDPDYSLPLGRFFTFACPLTVAEFTSNSPSKFDESLIRKLRWTPLLAEL